MGFSPLGLMVSLGVLAPNLLLAWFPPRAPLPSVRVPAPVSWLERAGQASCMVVPATTAPESVVWWWVLAVVGGLACYYVLWGRYLADGREAAALYRSWCGLPAPMAILPVIVFFAAAALLNNLWIAVAALVLAAGHVPAAVLIARTAGVRQ